MNIMKLFKKIAYLSISCLIVLLAFAFTVKKGKTEDYKGALNFLIISDWGWNGFKSQQEVADQMAAYAEKTEPKFIISCGDNFQVQGVASVQDPLWISNYENIYKNISLQVDWYPVLGNHDYKGNTQAEIDYSKISRRWRLESHYYTFAKKINDSVSARFIFLDTSPFVTEYYNKPGFPDIIKQDTAQQLIWLKEVLKNSKEQWKLVFGHHPIYSASHVHGNTIELIEKIKPILKKYHAQVYFSGHDHDLQHLKEQNEPIDYFVTGAGGEPRPSSSNKMTLYSNSVPAFSSVILFGDSLQVNFINSKGVKIYSYKRSYK